jgi:DNA-binding LacI/PurR family transcriptional regulator
MATTALLGQRTIAWISTQMEWDVGKALTEACGHHHVRWLGYQTRVFVQALQALHDCEAGGVAGLLLHHGHADPVPADIIQRFQARGVPVVTYNFTLTACPVDWVGLDVAALGALAVDYLADLGHRRIALLGQLSKGPTFWIP